MAVNDGGGLLDMLDPSINSLPYIYALLAKLRETESDGCGQSEEAVILTPNNPLFTKACLFLESFDGRQVRYAGARWRQLVELVARAALESGDPSLAVQPLQNAILHLDPTSSTFTSNHLLFVRLCLRARTFEAALPVIDRDILDFPSSNPNIVAIPATIDQASSNFITTLSGISKSLSHTDHLEYYYYSAMIYMALKQWNRAIQCLEYVLSTPTANLTSKIMVTAYKKWVLASLIQNGRLLPLPRPIYPRVVATFHGLARGYDALAELFRLPSVTRLQLEIAAGTTIWATDHNAGLVQQLPLAHLHHTTLNLSHTYSTLSLSQLSSIISVPPIPLSTLEANLRELIDNNLLPATLSHPVNTPSAILNFPTPPTATPSSTPTNTTQPNSLHPEQRMLLETEAITQRITTLNTHIHNLQTRFTLRQEVIDVLKRDRERDREREREKEADSGTGKEHSTRKGKSAQGRYAMKDLGLGGGDDEGVEDSTEWEEYGMGGVDSD